MDRRQLHGSYLFIALTIGLVVGEILAYFVILKFSPSWLLLIAIILVVVAVSANYLIKISLMVVVGLLAGWLIASPYRVDSLKFDQLVGKTVTISGRLYDDVAMSSSGQLKLRLENLKIANQPVRGSLLVTSRSRIKAKRGDEITVIGKLDSALAGYNGLINQAEVTSVLANQDWGLKVRNWLTSNLERHLSPLQSSLASAFLVGKRREIPLNFDTELRIVGLSHLVVASGFHLTTIVRATKRSFGAWSRRSALLAGLAVIGLFLAITGLSSSMVRAAFVSLVSLLIWYTGRTIHPARLLVIAFALTVLFNPFYLWGDVSFYLSFSAFFGVLILSPLLQAYFWGETKLGFWSQLVVESISAQLMTIPVSLYFFNQLSTVMLVTNLLVVPTASLIMLLSFGVSLLALVPILNKILIFGLQLLLNYLITIVHWFSQIPYASLNVNFNLLGLLISYLLISLLTAGLAWRVKSDSLTKFNVVE